MKTSRAIIILIFISIALYFFVRQNTTQSPEKFSPNTDTNEPLDVCYASINVQENGFQDKYSLRIHVQDTKANGEIQFLPAEKDKKTGTFTGGVDTPQADTSLRSISGLWESHAEGMENTEEIRIRFDARTATIGMGEMADSGDGVYKYVDPEHISYSLELGVVSCADLDERQLVEKYVRDNIATLAPVDPVLGGSWYVYSVSVDTSTNTGRVVFEDGHIQSIATFTYAIQDNTSNVSFMKLEIAE